MLIKITSWFYLTKQCTQVHDLAWNHPPSIVSVQGSNVILRASDLPCRNQKDSQWLEDNGEDTVCFSKSTAFHSLGNVSDQMGKTNVGVCTCVCMCAQACACVPVCSCSCVYVCACVVREQL